MTLSVRVFLNGQELHPEELSQITVQNKQIDELVQQVFIRHTSKPSLETFTSASPLETSSDA